MPNFNLSQQPQYPIVTKDTDIALTNDQIQSLFCNKDSITLCVRSSSGHPNTALKCSQFPSCVDFTGFNCIQNCVYCYYLSFFSKIALKHRPHYFHI